MNCLSWKVIMNEEVSAVYECGWVQGTMEENSTIVYTKLRASFLFFLLGGATERWGKCLSSVWMSCVRIGKRQQLIIIFWPMTLCMTAWKLLSLRLFTSEWLLRSESKDNKKTQSYVYCPLSNSSIFYFFLNDETKFVFHLLPRWHLWSVQMLTD